MDVVDTIFGPIPRDELDVCEQVVENGTARTIRTIWTLRRDMKVDHEGQEKFLEFVFHYQDGAPPKAVQSRKGEVVKADAHVIMKRGIEGRPEQGFLNS